MLNKFELIELGKVLEVQNGFAFDSEKFSEIEGMPLIRIRDLKNGIKTEIKFNGNFDDKFVVKKGDLLIGMDGEFQCYKWKGENALLNQRVCRLINFNKNTYPNYIFYGINSYLKKIEQKTTFVTVKHISSKQIKEIKFPLPTLPEQIKIAKILSEVEELITQRKESIALLDELVKSTFYKMFGDPVKNEKGWDIRTLDELVKEFKYGTNTISNEKISLNSMPILRIPNIIGEKINYDNLKYSEIDEKEKEKIKLHLGDILFVRSNGNPSYIARCAVFNDSGNYGYASYLIRARLKENITIKSFFIKDVLSFPSYRSILINKATTTAGNYNINTDSLKSLKIINPDKELQNKFNKIVEEIEEIKTHYQQSLKELENLFDVLSQKAFKGELDLSKMEIEAEDNDLKKDSGQARMTFENEDEKEFDNLNKDSKQLKITFEKDSEKFTEEKTSENFETETFDIIKYPETDIRSKFHQFQPLSYDENGIIDYSAYNPDLEFKYDNLSFEYLHGIIMQDQLKGKFTFKELEDELKSLRVCLK